MKTIGKTGLQKGRLLSFILLGNKGKVKSKKQKTKSKKKCTDFIRWSEPIG